MRSLLSAAQARVSSINPSTILVITKEPLIQTLMCSLVDLAGHRALLIRDDETVMSAIRRVRPDLLLLDCEHDCSREAEVYDAAEGAGAEVLLFTPARTSDEAAAFAKVRGLSSMALPVRLDQFSETLETLLRA